MHQPENSRAELDHASFHRPWSELEERFRALPEPCKDLGRVVMIVRRNAPGVHEALSVSYLTREDGVPGDEWNRRLPKKIDGQLTVISSHVAELVSNGRSLTISGDNLVVDLDISAGNLPLGTRLRVGEAVVAVTPKPHNGCSKFAARFGQDALMFVNAPATRARNLRGMYWKVIEDGTVRTGSIIQVLSRPAPAGM